MADPAGEIRFPGLAPGAAISAQFALSHGISPSVCTITCVPQPPSFTPSPGALQLLFGGTVLRFPDCIIDDFSASRGPGGETWTLQIIDRRWKWKFAEPIWGQYNTRLENGEVARGDDPTADTELFAPSRKSPQELAKLCLEKMREQNADVSQLPNNTYPEIFWDFVNPAEALQAICEALGCRIILGLDNRVSIQWIGKGRELPNDQSVMEDSLTLDLQAKPDVIWCVCAPARLQCDFKLEAVGLDTDGTVKPIDKLSYKPTGGWNTIDMEHFQQVSEGTARDLAKATVFRWYRIVAPTSIPGYGKLKHGIHQILLEDSQVEQTTDAKAGTGAGKPRKYNKPAQVHGIWYPGTEDLKNVSATLTPPTNDTKVYQKGFSIDRDRKLVKFGDQVYANSVHTANNSTPASIGYVAADIILRTACIVLQASQVASGGNVQVIHQEDNLGISRYIRFRQTGGNAGTGPYQIRREDLILGIYPKYSSNSGQYRSQVTSGNVPVTTNLQEIDQQADYYIQAAMDDFNSKVPQARTYAGLKAIAPDGAIQQVAWFIGPQGTITRASRNNEQVDLSISFQERRFQQKLQAMLKAEQKNEQQKRRDRKRGG